jgi:hypothetical protein
LLVGHGDVDRHVIWREKVADVHGSISLRLEKEMNQHPI